LLRASTILAQQRTHRVREHLPGALGRNRPYDLRFRKRVKAVYIRLDKIHLSRFSVTASQHG
jgi:hypothetical protein